VKPLNVLQGGYRCRFEGPTVGACRCERQGP
jgi:hypothetical protein